MNLPNKLTILRMLMVPVFVFFLLTDINGAGRLRDFLALGFFIAADLTDFLDGYIARKYDLVTNFGKFMDPLADKLLVGSAIICLVALDRLPAWIAVVIIGREFIISGFRLVASDRGIVIAAGKLGKTKTTVQVFMVGFLIAHFEGTVWHIAEQVLIYAALLLTVISVIGYIWNNREVLKDDSSGK